MGLSRNKVAVPEGAAGSPPFYGEAATVWWLVFLTDLVWEHHLAPPFGVWSGMVFVPGSPAGFRRAVRPVTAAEGFPPVCCGVCHVVCELESGREQETCFSCEHFVKRRPGLFVVRLVVC